MFNSRDSPEPFKREGKAIGVNGLKGRSSTLVFGDGHTPEGTNVFKNALSR